MKENRPIKKEQMNERIKAKTLDEYLALPYPIELVQDEGSWVAAIPDLPGCVSFGDTPDKAVAGVNETKEMWLDARLKSGQPIPEPSAVEEFSGKFVLRIPRSLHKSLDSEAKKQGVSLNQYLSHILSERHTIFSFEQCMRSWSMREAAALQHLSLAGAYRDWRDLPEQETHFAVLGRMEPTKKYEVRVGHFDERYEDPWKSQVFAIGQMLSYISHPPKHVKSELKTTSIKREAMLTCR